MRESINGAWLIGIIMVFMAVFIAYTAISVNYSNAFLMRTKMVTAIEQYEGLNGNSLEAMKKIMDSYGYNNRGACGDGKYGVFNTTLTKSPNGKNYHYCVGREVRYEIDRSLKVGHGTDLAKYYYSLNVFFDFNLPVLGDIFRFNVSGETNAIYYPNDTYF